MEIMAELSKHMKERPLQLYQEKEQGKKVVGFFPGDFVPEELIYAAGAIPVCLVHGGTTEPVEAASYAASRVLCPFSKTAIGLWTLAQPYYRLVDLLVAPISCNHLRRTADMWYYFTGTEVFYLGVPHEHGAEHALQYYIESLKALKERLERLTGQKVDDEKLKDSITIYNEIRAYLKRISELRKSDVSPIKGSEFVALNHESYYSDPDVMRKALKAFYENRKGNSVKGSRPRGRVMLAGPNLSMGDTKVMSIVEKMGGQIVIEEICEGVRYYWENISTQGDLINNIGEKYLMRRVPCAFQGQGTLERMDFMEMLAREFRIDGVIWYQLRYCETYNAEYYYVQNRFQKNGIPIMKIESEYDPSDHGQISTRIDAFLEMVERRTDYVR